MNLHISLNRFRFEEICGGRCFARLMERCAHCRGEEIGAGECVLKIELFEVERIGRSGACARRSRAGTR
ncbi:hypothetical protein ELH21_05000 [Rhizobium leguminosarum]|nr:hypothetical protein ELH21_05000 [Rhizobium leguminosarum]